MTFHVPERYRLADGPMGSDVTYRNNGAFQLPGCIPGRQLFAVASDDREPGAEEISERDGRWEHVSVSGYRGPGRPSFMPNWEEMCYVKRLFWDPEDVVVQYHPAESDYVNFHESCLHLWRPVDQVIPIPDPIRVGPKGKAEVA